MKTNRIFALLLAVIMLLSIFTGCNTTQPNVTDPSGSIGSAEPTGTDGTDSTSGTTDTTTGTEDPAGNETISGTETTEPSNTPTTNPTNPNTQPTTPDTKPTQPSGCSHNWSSWTTKTAATCTADGSEERTCSKCGEKEQRTTKATGHTWDSGKESGSNITYTCKACGSTKTEQIKGNHTFGEWKWEEYTYTQDGVSRISHRKYRACTKCGYKETDGTPNHYCARGSDNHVVTTVKEGTCSTKATMRSTCKVCGWYVEYEGKKGKCNWVDKTVHLSDYGTYTNELDATVSECTSCGDKSVSYHKGEGWSDYNRYRMKWSTVTGAAYAGQPTTDNFAYIDHPEWQTVYRNFKYDSEGYVKEFTIYWWYNGSRYSQVIDCGEGVWESWFAEYNMADDGAYNYTYQIRCFGTYWEPWKRTWTSQSG